MVGYRLHFEAGTLDALERVRRGDLGELRFFSSVFAQHVAAENHRGHSGFNAGPVADMGPYPINAVRNFFGAEPVEVSAFGTRNADAGLGEFDDTVAVTLRFGDGRLAQFVVSYAGSSFGAYTLVGTKGVLEMMGDAVAAKAPLKRVGGPEDLKGLTVLLASEAGAFITGQILTVDGGTTIQSR